MKERTLDNGEGKKALQTRSSQKTWFCRMVFGKEDWGDPGRYGGVGGDDGSRDSGEQVV